MNLSKLYCIEYLIFAFLNIPMTLRRNCKPKVSMFRAPPYSRRINTIRQKRQCVTYVTNFWILIIFIHTSRFDNRIKQIWYPLLFINRYLRMEYTLFQDFARKIPRPAPPTGRPGRTQSGRKPEFDYGSLHWTLSLEFLNKPMTFRRNCVFCALA